MSSSTSNSDRTPGVWRRFLTTAVGTAIIAAALIYLFLVTVDPFDTLPLSPRLDRAPVATNARFSFPALARSKDFDSAIFGTSTSRLLRPVALDPEFGVRFVNLSMNAATAYEQSRLLQVFAQAHPDARAVLLGLDQEWCETGDDVRQFTPRPFPEWMYDDNRWNDYRWMFNLYAIEQAANQFAIVTGMKKPRYGRDGYTSFVPDDRLYDPARVAQHLREATVSLPSGERSGPSSTWRFPSLEMLERNLRLFSPASRKVLFFVPYNHVLLPGDNAEARAVWDECKRRVAAIARAVPGTRTVDFMIPSPITDEDANYWDPLHFRIGIADRLAHDLDAASRGVPSPSGDYRLPTEG